MRKNTSIWIFDRARAVGALFGALMLAGCMESGGGLVSRLSSPVDRVSVADNRVTVTGPSGYCVDRNATRARVQPAFVMLASCAAVSRNADAPAPRVPALLTATVANQTAPVPASEIESETFRAFFTSTDGRAALARDGRADSVEILDMFRQSGVFFIHANDHSAVTETNLREDFWRAIFDVNGRTVSASLFVFRNRPISDDAGLSTLNEFASRIRAASAGE